MHEPHWNVRHVRQLWIWRVDWSACFRKVRFYHCVTDSFPPAPTTASKRAVHVLLCLCNNACKISLAIYRKNWALCPVSRLLSVPIYLHALNMDVNMIQSINQLLPTRLFFKLLIILDVIIWFMSIMFSFYLSFIFRPRILLLIFRLFRYTFYETGINLRLTSFCADTL